MSKPNQPLTHDIGRKMTTLADIEAFRKTPEAVAFATAWISETREKEVGEKVMSLSLWVLSHPFHALGIILNLLEVVGEEEDVAEMIAMGPVTEIVESTDDTFTPILRAALSAYPKFALYTKSLREKSEDVRWTRLSK